MAKQLAATIGGLSRHDVRPVDHAGKSPGIILVGIGKTWRRLLEKCLLRVTGQEAKSACRTEQLADGVEAGIKGAINATRLQCTQHSQEDEWGFLLIDARNVFNEENRQR